jgi:hypothetical protein
MLRKGTMQPNLYNWIRKHDLAGIKPGEVLAGAGKSIVGLLRAINAGFVR